MQPKDMVRAGRRPVLVLVAVLAVWTGCAKPRVAEIYPQVSEYDGRRIEELTFTDPEPFGADSLAALTETEATRCALLGIVPFCFPGTDWGLRVGRLNMRTVGQDLARLEQLYRQTGYFGTRVIPEIEEVGEDGGPIRLRLRIRRGDGIELDSLEVEGTEGIADPDSLEAELPLQPGELFALTELVASADTVLEVMRERGHAYAEILRNYGVDTIQDRATVQLLAIPGPRVEVDTVLVAGAEELEREDVLRQLTFDQGDLLRVRDLRTSQRNLYDLQLIRLASVAVAGDTLQRTPADSTTATVRVAIGEAPEHVVETEVGYGSVECFGLRGRWTDRSVFGGSRRLTLTGEVSRIGLGDPLGGLENSVCQEGGDREIATTLDYRVAADFAQSYFLGPGNQLSATLFSERQSEPELYQRTGNGGRLDFTRRIRRRELLTAGVSVEYRTTDATPALYCFEFRACGSEDIARFLGGRWQNGLTANWLRDRSNATVNPTDGYVLRSSASWSTSLLGSDFDFLRANVEGSIYQPIGGDWVLAGFARFGSFVTRASLGPDNFIPPEERFFAGGANSVRGFDRFSLGPGLYLLEPGDSAATDPRTIVPADTLPVEFFPTGGTSAGVLSVEARFPSPLLRDLLRLAVFVDAGTVGLDPIWELQSSWRVTPGLGLRIQTPVGPARVDLGYNPYPAQSASLYATDPGPDGELVRIADDFQPAESGRFDLDRFRLHIAVGQAF
jgi:outer membrane protein assembly factor BamA